MDREGSEPACGRVERGRARLGSGVHSDDLRSRPLAPAAARRTRGVPGGSGTPPPCHPPCRASGRDRGAPIGGSTPGRWMELSVVSRRRARCHCQCVCARASRWLWMLGVMWSSEAVCRGLGVRRRQPRAFLAAGRRRRRRRRQRAGVLASDRAQALARTAVRCARAPLPHNSHARSRLSRPRRSRPPLVRPRTHARLSLSLPLERTKTDSPPSRETSQPPRAPAPPLVRLTRARSFAGERRTAPSPPRALCAGC